MISVILATRNGARTLGRTLDAFARLERPASNWQLIAVDNGSTDRTPVLLEERLRKLPMTILREPRPGKSTALNLALPLAREGIVAFVDDDIVPNADWLQKLEAAIAANPGYALFAGRILPLWEVEPPSWVLKCVDVSACYGVHAERQEGPCPHYILYGGNMAIRAEAIGAALFDESYGPNATAQFAMGGETEFVRLLSEAGSKAWYCRDAVVRHSIPPEHMRIDWLLNRAANFGRGQYRVGGDPMLPDGSGGLRTARSLRRTLLGCRWRAVAARLRGDDVGRFRALWRLNYIEGFAAEHAAATARVEGTARPRRELLRGELLEPSDAQ